MDMCKTVSNLAQSIPVFHHVLTRCWLWRGLHEIVQISSVCVFEYNIPCFVVQEAAIVGDDEWRRLSIVPKSQKRLSFGIMLFLCIQPPIRLEYESVPEFGRTLLIRL